MVFGTTAALVSIQDRLHPALLSRGGAVKKRGHKFLLNLVKMQLKWNEDSEHTKQSLVQRVGLQLTSRRY